MTQQTYKFMVYGSADPERNEDLLALFSELEEKGTLMKEGMYPTGENFGNIVYHIPFCNAVCVATGDQEFPFVIGALPEGELKTKGFLESLFARNDAHTRLQKLEETNTSELTGFI